ncbi:O-antigen ligase [Homoserinimonas aerilata]|uniref:O-antigen ligase n=1 Tax=Homoserinimonas aerilata TaxID=1162970 RepID=A0A542YKL5_9MICO|nr:O-antigen ligase family protein [Homoserinimonas aerilata]TQL48633.1 O-antigen ligase [Homoserinimonas aerilata]
MTHAAAAKEAYTAFFSSPRLASALATASVGLGVFAFALHRTMGWPALHAMLGLLALLSLLSLWARRESLNLTGLVPISLAVFVLWAAASVFWSQYQWATLGSLAYLFGFGVLGMHVALLRDTIQIIRAFADVLRFTFIVSLALEVLSGLLIDTPIRFLGIGAHLDQLGPISGIIGNRNELGMLAVIAGISFVIEWRTRAVEPAFAVGSLALAGVTLVLTASPIAWGTAFVAAAATAVLYGVRKLAPRYRRYWQLGTLALAAVLAVLAWSFRTPIITALNGGGELAYRLTRWREMLDLIPLHPLEGWGFIGQWNNQLPPYVLFVTGDMRETSSALNAYLDVWFQLGFVGLVAFIGVLGLAFTRSWLLAARQRSVMYTWPAIVLAALITAGLAESSLLVEFGWLTFVICCVKASQKLSWRRAFERPLEQEPLG